VKARTTRPFGVNLRSDAPDAQDRVRALIRAGVKVASFAQAPKQELIKELKDAGLVVIPSIGAKRHAEKVAQWGVDAVLIQGHEAGGHVGQVATGILLPQVVDTVDIPVIAAGGFFDGRGLVAALSYGAAGIAMGTRFLLTSDSAVPDAIKQVYLQKAVTDTVVSTRVDAANTPMLLKATMVDGRPEAGVMAGGQVVGVIDDLPSCQQLIDRIVDEAEKTLARLCR
jgi:NAD(P)H-dependent flavin oxidoreductase YrpB (nitropropane dioxygenase family)